MILPPMVEKGECWCRNQKSPFHSYVSCEFNGHAIDHVDVGSKVIAEIDARMAMRDVELELACEPVARFFRSSRKKRRA